MENEIIRELIQMDLFEKRYFKSKDGCYEYDFIRLPGCIHIEVDITYNNMQSMRAETYHRAYFIPIHDLITDKKLKEVLNAKTNSSNKI